MSAILPHAGHGIIREWLTITPRFVCANSSFRALKDKKLFS